MLARETGVFVEVSVVTIGQPYLRRYGSISVSLYIGGDESYKSMALSNGSVSVITELMAWNCGG